MPEPRPKSLDELRELAAAMDDLASHPAWASVVGAAQTLFGERVTLDRIAGLCAAGATPERVGAGVLDLMAAHRTAKQMTGLPEELAKRYRASADRIVQAGVERDPPTLGPDVELTTGRR